jgi:hypothetical protein
MEYTGTSEAEDSLGSAKTFVIDGDGLTRLSPQPFVFEVKKSHEKRSGFTVEIKGESGKFSP